MSFFFLNAYKDNILKEFCVDFSTSYDIYTAAAAPHGPRGVGLVLLYVTQYVLNILSFYRTTYQVDRLLSEACIIMKNDEWKLSIAS